MDLLTMGMSEIQIRLRTEMKNDPNGAGEKVADEMMAQPNISIDDLQFILRDAIRYGSKKIKAKAGEAILFHPATPKEKILEFLSDPRVSDLPKAVAAKALEERFGSKSS